MASVTRLTHHLSACRRLTNRSEDESDRGPVPKPSSMTQQESRPCPRRLCRRPTLLWMPGPRMRPGAEAVPRRPEAACRTGQDARGIPLDPGGGSVRRGSPAAQSLAAARAGRSQRLLLPRAGSRAGPPSRQMPTANRPASRALADALPAHRSHPSACPQRANVQTFVRRRRERREPALKIRTYRQGGGRGSGQPDVVRAQLLASRL